MWGHSPIHTNSYKNQTIKPHRNTLQNLTSPDIQPGKPTPASWRPEKTLSCAAISPRVALPRDAKVLALQKAPRHPDSQPGYGA